MKRLLKKLWSSRPFRTFLQGFMGVFFGSQLLELKDINMLKTLVISAIMAGISAVMSLNTGEEPNIVVVGDEDVMAEEDDKVEGE